MIDGLATQAHYVDHLAAVLNALPQEARGSVIANAHAVAERALAHGLSVKREGEGNPTLVASYSDLRTARDAGLSRIALMEHGAGQSYGGRHGSSRRGSYAGGQNRDAASLFLHPGPHPASRDRAAYPAARVEVVGSPHLDTLPPRKGPKGRTVAVSFHFNGPICPETRNAYPDFFPAVAALRDRFDVIGHAHPMLFDRLAPRYAKAGIEAVRDFAEVCERADLYVCDNSSTLFAFAATGRPVVVMNSPRYDRRVNHGLRFWEAAGVGINCDRPDALGDCIEEAFRDTPAQQAARDAALDLVYAYRSGAGKRAADVLMDWAA